MLSSLFKPAARVPAVLSALLVFMALTAFIFGCSSEKEPVADKGCMDIIVYDSAVEIENKPWLDQDLLVSLCNYWITWAKGDPHEVFSLEAPYFQEMVEFELFSNYLKLVTKDVHEVESLEILGIDRITDNYIAVRMNTHILNAEGQAQMTGRRDQWIKAGGSWHHVIKNPLIFQNVS